MKKRLLALFLAFVMAMSLLPVSVFAAGEGKSVANGYYEDGVWREGGIGTIKDTDTGIQMSKTATPDRSDPNKYTIALEVKTSTKTTVTDPSAAAVVLVMDLSNSMKACAECGEEGYHDEDCRYHDGLFSPVKNSQTRLAAAKNAAADFLEEYAGNSATAKRQLAIVAFGTTSKTVFSWNNVAGGAGKNSYDEAKNAIDGLTTRFKNGTQTTLLGSVAYYDGGGTNLEAGIQLGANLVGMNSIASVSAKNVIVLTDGVPTYRMSNRANRTSTDALCSGGNGVDGSGKNGSWDNNNNAKNAADNVKQKNATLYTVCFGVAGDTCYDGGPTIDSFLSTDIASSGCAYDADNTEELNEVFKAIGDSITEGIEGSGLVVTDPMGEYINLNAVPEGATETGNGFTWTLSNPKTSTENGVTYYTYRLSYTITVDADAVGFNEDSYHPANGPTYITIPGEDGKPKDIYFPVPGVKGTSTRYTVTYAPGDHGTLAGAGADRTVVYENLKKGGNTPAAPAVTPEEGYYFTGWNPEWSETVTGTVTYTAQYEQQGEITVQANSNTVTYTGNMQTVSGYTTTGLPEGFTLEGLTATASGTDAGSYLVQVTGTAVIKDQDDNDVTDRFIVNRADGKLLIEKRNVTLTSATAQKEYDGTPLTNNTVTVSGDGWADGEGATYNVTGSQLVKDSSANTFTYTLNEGTKADNYNITKTEGTLTIIDRESKYEITVVAKSDTQTYNGQTQTLSGFETLTFTLVENRQTYTVSGLTASGSGKDAGSYDVRVTGTAVVTDAYGNNVTDQFSVKNQPGKLTINPRTVTLTSADASKEYDGLPLTNHNVAVTGDGWVDGEGATYNVTGTRTLVGSAANTFTYTLNDNTNPSNYNIQEVEGNLTVTNRSAKYQIEVEANSGSCLYDGTEKTVEGFKTLNFTMENGATFTVSGLTATATGKDAGSYSVNVTGTAKVCDKDGSDVTDQFAVTTKAGTLDITKRNVTLTSASATKAYDGTALTNDTVIVGGDGFAEGEGATYIVTGSQTLPDNSQNAFTYTLNAGTKASNYTITPRFGTLTITDRPVGGKYPITVTAKSGEFVYDGTEKTVSGFETLTFTVEGKQYTVEGLTAEAKATNLGTYSVAITGTAVVMDAENHDVTAQFDITKVNGTMTILGTLTYNGNGQGENPAVNGVPTDDGQYAKDAKKTLSEEKPTHSAVNGKKVVFIGWSMTKSNKIYSASENYGDIVSEVTFLNANITVYAVWGYDSNDDDGHHSKYTLYYHSNFGEDVSFYQSSSTRDVTVKEYDDVGRLPERDGYVFVSWNTEPDGSGTRYMPGDTFRIDGSSDHLYAQWQKDKTGPDDSGVSNWLETDEHRAYLTGYPDSTFRADRNMTRAEVAQMFYALLLDKNVTITKSFSDVPDDAWYATAVKTLASLGMMDGYPDGTFRPDEPITRAEFATVGLAFAYDPLDASCSYYDVGANAWYYTYVAQATTYGWIGGYPDNTFRPGNNITRVEVCVIVNNMLGRDADERYIDRHEDELVHFVDLSDSYWGYYTIMESTNTHEYTGSFTNEKWTDVK